MAKQPKEQSDMSGDSGSSRSRMSKSSDQQSKGRIEDIAEAQARAMDEDARRSRGMKPPSFGSQRGG
ncbi:hypothetical protein OHA84_17425 [Streptomyces sp. NBC_00513]|uniref:hypothetical protein n=1 Tax=unclassified Streptomyces TaxID=2593676 RepID=UPI00225AF0A2|nr:hypothetical protein [Streptomyces sp. NBC_00424]MCX5074684.1 hypothetical protein [Streptomyces sp. NBC_00424]WUD42145.1 hypothetical protein OHA84_17425 [Streptomyces sp. NBC_00513]